jgi:1-phosphofructokinase family hexose kinase
MILCVGTTPVMQRSMIFDALHLDEVNRAHETSDYASGKSINVAKVAHTLGEDVLATGFLGGDSGRFIRSELDAAGVRHDFVEVEPRTRQCITIIDRGGGQVTELVEESRPVDATAWDVLRSRVPDLIAMSRLLLLSGSLPPGAPQDFYGFCIDRATAANVRVILDAAGEPLKRALPRRPFVVKPNRSELAKTLGVTIDSDASLRDAIKQLIALGPSWAIVTEGKTGVTVSNGHQFWRIKAPTVKTISPIGSGDSLAAGVAVALVRGGGGDGGGQEMPDSVRLGVACGAANAMTDRAGILRKEDVDDLLPRIAVESWA